MKFSGITAILVGAATLCAAHPERLTEESAKHELVGRGSNKCAAQIEARKAAVTGGYISYDMNSSLRTANGMLILSSQACHQSPEASNRKWKTFQAQRLV